MGLSEAAVSGDVPGVDSVRYRLMDTIGGVVAVVPEPASPPAPPAASDGRIEIALSSGHRVSANGSFDVEALCRVVRALGG